MKSSGVREKIKQLEKDQLDFWRKLIIENFQPQMFDSYVKGLDYIENCIDPKLSDQEIEECFKKPKKMMLDQDRYLMKLLNTYQRGIEDCNQNCLYNFRLEVDECYVLCFERISKILKKKYDF